MILGVHECGSRGFSKFENGDQKHISSDWDSEIQSSYKRDSECVSVCLVERQETKYCGGNLSARKL